MEPMKELQHVEAIEAKALIWNDTYATPEAADAAVRQEIDRVRNEHNRGGLQLVTQESLDAYEDQWRKNRDREALTAGATIETDVAIAAAILDDRIDAAKVLTPWLEAPISRTERQGEELVSLLFEDKTRSKFEKLTRTDAVNAYEKADETTQAGRRLAAFLEAEWPSMTFRDDPEHDSIAIMRLRGNIEKRQLARVPAHLIDAQTRLQRLKASSAFDFTMRHLRSGRGIASRPKPATYRPTMEVA